MTIEVSGLGLPRFSVGTVLSLSFSLLKSSFLRFLLLSLILVAPIFVLAALAFSYIGYTAGLGLLAGADMSSGGIAMFGLLIIAVAAAYFIFSGAIAYGAIEDLRGSRPGIGECIGQAFRALPQLIGTAIVMILAMIALVLPLLLTYFYLILLVPAVLFILICWWVVVPVILAERPGVIAALSRSFALTSGDRWSILGIMLVMAVINWALNFILSAFMPIAPLLFVILSLVASLIISVWSAILPAIGYCLLRNEKEGADITTIAKVFE